MAKKRSLDDMVRMIAKTPLDSSDKIVNSSRRKTETDFSFLEERHTTPEIIGFGLGFLYHKLKKPFLIAALIAGIGYGVYSNYNNITDFFTPKSQIVETVIPKSEPIQMVNQIPESIDSHVRLSKGEYFVGHNIEVGKDGILEVEPGTVFKFSKHVGLYVLGTLRAVGSEDKKIIFTSLNNTDKWDGIKITKASKISSEEKIIDSILEYFSSEEKIIDSILEYCVVSNSEGSSSGEFDGGLYIENSNPKIRNCVIEKNSLKGIGGGIYLSGSDALLVNNIIRDNSAKIGGGGLYIWSSNPTLNNNKILKNHSGVGGGIYISKSEPIFKNNTIKNNTASYGGGGIYISESKPIFKNNTITNNTAYFGGGIYLDNSSVDISNNTIKNNKPNNVNAK